MQELLCSLRSVLHTLQRSGSESRWDYLHLTGLTQRRQSWETQRKLLPFGNRSMPGSTVFCIPVMFPLPKVMTILIIRDNGQKVLFARECCAWETVLFKAFLESRCMHEQTHGISSILLPTHPSFTLTTMHEPSHLGMPNGQTFFCKTSSSLSFCRTQNHRSKVSEKES